MFVHLMEHESIERQSKRQDQEDYKHDDTEQRFDDFTKHHHVNAKMLKPKKKKREREREKER